MRVSKIVLAALPLTTLLGCQTLGERVNYVRYDGYTSADFATAGADGSVEVATVGAPAAGMPPEQAARKIAEAMTGSNFGPKIPFQAQSGAAADDGYQIVVRFGQPPASGALCSQAGDNAAVSGAFTAAFCKDGAALSYVSGFTEGRDASLQSIMALTAIELFPMENPDFVGCNAARIC